MDAVREGMAVVEVTKEDAEVRTKWRRKMRRKTNEKEDRHVRGSIQPSILPLT